ncbi:guanine deaminase [Sphingomonas oleivorans]|uniref:Guanine deaminase n=1 Tax=Sphingomonas oleivorans TaxID=1735121 RepID=A0A2T5FYB9_9SPHN|nr:guanine deaminase [Sphingomonas oleivorans]PTQ11530.1 guanine deaminase [Sphingomonas oleivorans]
MTVHAYRGEILTTLDDPLRGGEGAVVHHPKGMIVVEDGVIADVGRYSDLAWKYDGVPVTELGGLIVPGFVDTHVHYPQTDRIAAHGEQLLDWLDRHIFPAERAFADRTHADEVAAFFLDELLRNGTTSALVFATVHKASVEALFDAALARNMRIVSGKVLMDQGAPDGLRDTVAGGRADSEALIAAYRGRGRLGYAVTPRFVLTSSDAQLADAGAMVATHRDVLMHTHLSENRGEIAAVAGRFPTARDYLDVYDRFGLVGDRSVFAHCIHLDDAAMAHMGRAGASIAFCPTSNLFLGSGLFDLARADAHGVKAGMGTDVGAGTSFSILHTLGEAYKVCQMRGASLDPFRALYLATLGGARTLGLGDRIGALAPGYEADFLVLDPAATPLLARRSAAAETLHDRLFALQILGDDRAVAQTYVAGRLAHARNA